MAEKKRIMMIRPGKRFPRMGFAQPLGLLTLISVLRKHFPEQFEVCLVEQALYDLSAEQVAERMKSFQPDLVLFSALSVEGNELRELTAISKQLFPQVPVWIGGPHATFFYDWELQTGKVDAVCLGEGEETFREMIEAWLAGRPLSEVAGLALLVDGQVVKTPERALIEDLDSIPLPAWDLVDFEKYSLQISMNGFVHSTPWALLFTTRACPYQCVYCHCIFGKKTRKRSIPHVMTELEMLVRDYGVKEIHIVDDIFNLDLPRAKAICDEIVARGLKIKIAFPNGLRADRMDRELIQKLKAAGCYCITYAIETASPRLQKRIKKNLDLDKARQAIEWTYDEGLIPQAFFMLGFPGESREEMEMTIDFACNSRVLRAWFFGVVVYPRTGLFDMAKEEYPHFDFKNYDFFNLRYWADEPFYSRVTGNDLARVLRHAYRRFFLRPWVFLQIFLRFPKNKWFFRGFYWGLRATLANVVKLETIFRPLRKWLSEHLGILKE